MTDHILPLAHFGTFDNEHVYTVREVAEEILECDIGHVYDLISEGKLRAAHVGVGRKANYRIRASAIRDFFSAAEAEIAKRAEPTAMLLDAAVTQRGRRRREPPRQHCVNEEQRESRVEMVRRLRGR